MKHFFAELYQRLGSATPPFFKKLAAALLSLAAAAVAAVALPDYLPDWLPAEWLKTLATVCTGMATVCKLVVDWNKTSPDDVPAVPAPGAVQIVKAAYDLPADELTSPPAA